KGKVEPKATDEKGQGVPIVDEWVGAESVTGSDHDAEVTWKYFPLQEDIQ
ncbi:hypothetical protein A2U01_0109564, partial [Trifolium medium]|nr:hypothetical protein [Trifolium medium]